MTDDPISFDVVIKKPLLIILSGPSGVGKDAVLKALKERQTPLHFVVTATTRAARTNEVDGVDYFFVSMQEFQRMIAENELLEHSWVYEDLKGIPKGQIRQARDSGKDTILRIDVQGVEKVRKICPQAVTIFITPASEEDLKKRLEDRKADSPESLRLRMKMVRNELECLPQFDYVVRNVYGELERCVDAIITIIEAEHMRVDQRGFEL